LTENKTERAESQAKAQLESIVQMVKRLEHCQECDGGEECQLTDEEILEGINIYYKEGMTASEEDRGNYHDEDEARQAIEEDPLSVEVRGDWHQPRSKENDDIEYCILLCTGGPACRIMGDLDSYSQPVRARLEYQDWFTPWIELVDITHSEQALLTYARQFYFGG